MASIATLPPETPVSSLVTIRIPDHLMCLSPRSRMTGGRNHNHPMYCATISSPPSALVSDPGSWTLKGISAVEPECHVTFRRKQSTFSFLSVKAGRTQTGESHWEFLNAMEKEIDPQYVDYQLHGIVVRFECNEGARRYTVDSVAVTAEGSIVAEEAKASASYFAEPGYAALMTGVEKALATVRIEFRKVHGDQMQRARRRLYNITTAFNDRFTAFDQRQLDRVLDRLATEGAVPMRRIEESIGGNTAASRRIVNAMMCARHLAYDLDDLVDDDAAVSPPPPVAKQLPDIRAIGL